MRNRITQPSMGLAASVLAAVTLASAALAAPELVWYSIDGGAANLSGGTYTLIATAGQPDAGVALSGGTLRIAGGTFGTFTVTPCGPSDIASAGQQPFPDGELTSDDLIIFINRFISRDPRADVGRSGQQPGNDGEFTADDIIIFINRFITGC